MSEGVSFSKTSQSRWSLGDGSLLLAGGPAPGSKPDESFFIAGGLIAAFALGWLLRGRRPVPVAARPIKKVLTAPLTEVQKARLLHEACLASERGYRPYSKFPVGAALTAAINGGVKKGDFVAIALATPKNPASAPINLKSPCGSCRQVMIELMGEDALVLIDGAGEFTVGELLPHAFRLC